MTSGLKNKQNYYLQLINEFPPRPITNEQELILTQQRINNILSQEKLTQEDKDYLQVLGTLIYDYEEKYEPMPKVEGQEILQSLLSDFQVNPQDLLTIFDSESVIFDIIKGKRNLTEDETEKLTNYYICNFL
jgi:HTH-type transcriptional regulator/antitoxin HigA